MLKTRPIWPAREAPSGGLAEAGRALGRSCGSADAWVASWRDDWPNFAGRCFQHRWLRYLFYGTALGVLLYLLGLFLGGKSREGNGYRHHVQQRLRRFLSPLAVRPRSAVAYPPWPAPPSQ